LRKGEVVVSGRIAELLRRDARRTEITLRGEYSELRGSLSAEGFSNKEIGGLLVVEVEGSDALAQVLERALSAKLSVEQVMPRHETLEDLFMREAIASGEGASS
jgi:ABC-type uncharacterized transport system ATPase subunit